MKSLVHKAKDRGHVNFGWLDSHHSFSFGQYYDPKKMNFGALRVLNDDIVNGGGGFGKHPHENMEIVSIPLSGDLEHEDSTGTKEIIKENDIQIMSAGAGIQHSEKNHSERTPVNFLQIWVIPKVQNIQPRYDQKTFDRQDRHNKLITVVAPDADSAIWINQDAWFSIGYFDEGIKEIYPIHKEGNGAYVFVIDGTINIGGAMLNKRDAIGIWDISEIEIDFSTDAEILVIDVPMTV